jgi:tRNA A-37 threonylcarbamoyl transferase component Bud32
MGEERWTAMTDPVGRDATSPAHGDDTTTVDSPDDAAPRTSPRVLTGRYLLEERVASGGMASVWRAHDEVLARTVAVKLLHDHLAVDDDFRERFRREAIAAAKLTHPNVVSMYDTGADGDQVFLVMEFIDGSTLKDVIREQGGLDVEQAAAIGEQVARALDYAHSRGLVHRDVKPANILIGTDGAVKVADFGIAKADHGDDLTRTGMVLGTAAYVAPEQIRGEAVDGKADQYALAIVVYEALTGRQPFKADTPVATAAQRLERDPLPVRSLRADAPRGLDAVLMRALARDPKDRFPTAGAFADALAEFAGADTGETAALVGASPALGTSSGGSGEHPPAGTGEHAPASLGESFLRSEGRFLAPVLVLIVLAGALVGVGLATGVLETGQDGPLPITWGERAQDDPADDEAAPEEEERVIPVAATPQVMDPVDGAERDHELPALVDGDATTTWRTDQYWSRAFGNLKDGVGFWLDLGAPHELRSVELQTTTPGLTLQVRVADPPAGTVDGWTVVGSVDDAAAETIQIPVAEGTVSQYVLVWITGDLPQYQSGFAAQFTQVTVRGAPA